MNFDYSKLNNHSSPFYRVSAKLIIMDEQSRILVGKSKDDVWELPGGGLEHDESIEECLRCELEEELGVELKDLGEVVFVYRNNNPRGFKSLKIAMRASLKNYEFHFGELVDAKYITKKEFVDLPMGSDESGAKEFINSIWPTP